MANNLDELNKVLFETLRGVKDGAVEVKKAETIVGLGNSIINNAKVQLSAYKLSGGTTGLGALSADNGAPVEQGGENGFQPKPLELGFKTGPQPNGKELDVSGNQRTKKAYELAIELGFDHVAGAIAQIGGPEFNRALDDFIANGAVNKTLANDQKN